MSELVASIIWEQQDAGIPDLFDRDLSLGAIQKPARSNLVHTVVGVRHCGTTFRLYQEVNARCRQYVAHLIITCRSAING